MSSPFNIQTFKNQLRTTWLGSEFIFMNSVESTNTQLKQLPAEDLYHGTVLLTDNQTKGRGQYERNWESEPGQNLTFTIAFKPPTGERLTLLTLACAYAISKKIEEIIDQDVDIKWPNDLIVNGKKIGGVLTETMFNGSNLDRVLIGVGLNVRQTRFGDKLKKKATSVAILTGTSCSREQLLAGILSEIEMAYMKWHKFDNELFQKISRKMIGYGDWVQLQINGDLKPGKYKFLGVNQKGQLQVLNEQLDVNIFSYEQIRIITGRKRVSKTE